MKNRLKDLVDSALNGQTVFHLALMAGTGFAANSAILPKIIEFGLDPSTASMIAALVGMAAAVAIDGGFKKQLPYAVSVLFGKKDRATGVERKKGFNLVVVILVMITGGTSLFFNWKVTPEITQTIIQDPDGAHQTAMSATLAGKYDRDVSRLEKAVERAEGSLERANLDKEKAVRAAVNSLGSKMAQLVKSGNGWAVQETEKAKAKAERRHRQKIAAAEKDLSGAQAALSSYIGSAGLQVTTAQTSLVQSYEQEKVEARTAQVRWGSAFIVFWIVSFIGFIGCTVVVVVYEDETGEDVTHNPTVLSVIWKSIIRVKDISLAFVIRKASLESAFAMPALAGSAILQPTPTPRTGLSGGQSERNSDKSEPKSEKSQKSECKSGECPPKSGSRQKSGNDSDQRYPDLSGTTQSGEGWVGDEVGEEDNWEHQGYDMSSVPSCPEGGEWPHPSSHDEWKAFTKRVRGWYVQSYEASSEPTRERNRQKVIAFIAYIRISLKGFISFNSDERKLSINV